MKKIKVELSQAGIQKAIREVKGYKQSLIDKNEVFVQRLVETGVPVIDERIAAAHGDSGKNHNTYIRINSFGGHSRAVLTVEGIDILFIEFGAGIHYNGSAGGSPHPKGQEFGYTIGSYGKGQGKNDYWFYTAETGESVMSHGTEATMPVYSASAEIQRRIREIAKQVFQS